MPKADFFGRLGLFVIKDFLDGQLCDEFRLEARLASKGRAKIGDTGGERVDEGVRKTKTARVSTAMLCLVRTRLLDVKLMLESHFGLALADCEKPQFLVYEAQDFFRAHRDNTDDPDYPDDRKYVHERQVSVVVFLNSAAEEPGPKSYGGGSLTFYGLIDDPHAKTYGFPLVSEAGLLIAFRSDLLHEVTPVTYGERYTIVSWFF